MGHPAIDKLLKIGSPHGKIWFGHSISFKKIVLEAPLDVHIIMGLGH